MDITPLIPQGRQAIESYGAGGFRVSGLRHAGSILVFAERTVAWPVPEIAALTYESLAPLWEEAAPVEVLLIGCGTEMAFIDPDLRGALRDRGVVIEPMDTGAACRTYNVLLTEERRVAAALIAIA